MKVHEIMRQRPATVGPDEHLSLAVQLMLWTGARHLPVMEGGNLLGIISERDILRFRAEHPRSHVREAMSAPAHYIGPEEPIAVAAGRMADARLGCLPVVSRGELVGIITTTDVLKAMEREEFAGSEQVATEAGQFEGLVAKTVMTESVITALPDDSLADAAARMAQYSVRHLPVVDGDGRLKGMLSDRDLRLPPAFLRKPLKGEARDFLERTRVAQVMTSQVAEVRENMPASELLSCFADYRLSAVPVVDENEKLVGVISYVDVLKALGQATRGPAGEPLQRAQRSVTTRDISTRR